MKPKKSCIAFGCLNTEKNPNLSFHRLPKEEESDEASASTSKGPDTPEPSLVKASGDSDPTQSQELKFRALLDVNSADDVRQAMKLSFAGQPKQEGSGQTMNVILDQTKGQLQMIDETPSTPASLSKDTNGRPKAIKRPGTPLRAKMSKKAKREFLEKIYEGKLKNLATFKLSRKKPGRKC